MRVLFIGGTGPVGQSAVPRLRSAGHEVLVAHSGRHEAFADLEHLHGSRGELLSLDGTAERWRPEVAIAIGRAPAGTWRCNVGDPSLFTYGALARLVADRLDWEWEVTPGAYDDPAHDHPWNVRHPVYASVRRLESELEVREPDPRAATVAQIEWAWEHRDALKREFA